MSRSRARDDVDSDLAFHHREWRIQRIGWALVALFLALALGGLFGNGPLSHAGAGNAAGSIEYERFVRSGLSTEIVVTPAERVAGGIHRVAISESYLEAFRIENITPEPTAVRMTGESLVYEFESAASGASISFHIHPQRLGSHTAEVRIDAGTPLAIRQLTYP